MKVLIVNTYDSNGGAALAAYRLHKALKLNDVESVMLVQSKKKDDFDIIGEKSNFQKWINLVKPKADEFVANYFYKKKFSLFSPNVLPSNALIKRINKLNPDIVHLHWVCGGMIKIEDLAKINAPIVWNCHDMWPFTGGCHYDEYCGAYKNNCGNCKVLKSDKENDLSRKIFNRKLKVYSKIKSLTVIGSSKWISKCARESTLFRDKEVITIPNCIDTNLLKPIDKGIARGMFNIPRDKSVILFAAMNSLGDPRKGAKELFEAVNMLKIENTIFVIAGSSQPKEPLNLKYPTYFISPLMDEVSLALMYNVADVMIVPSLQENLANSIVESLSCGVPVVAFDIGGNADMIEHRKNGFLAEPNNSNSMAEGIEWIIKNKKPQQLALSAREKILNEFDSKSISKKYIDVYKKIVS